MATHRYGIRGMREEHFGMAPAEMLRAGMIVWVPNGGGQVEIVGSNADLVYDSEDDAVEKITRALRSKRVEDDLRAKLQEREAMFGTSRFVAEIQEIVGAFRA
jgi:glycosyltransferase involved in cell wall biosynthesis